MPLDLIPDIIFPVGFTDDAAALGAALAAVQMYVTEDIVTKAREQVRALFG